MRKTYSIVLAGILLLIFLFISVASAASESLTYDEIVHIQEGKNAILKHQFLIDTNNPPFIRELQVIPLVLNIQKYIPSPYPNMQAFPARFVTTIFGFLLGCLVFSVGAIVFDSSVGLLALFLYVFEPDILAHGHYITQDIGNTFFFFLSFVILILTLKKPSIQKFFVLGLTTGLLAASKINGLIFFLITALAISFMVLKHEIAIWLWRHKRNIGLTIIVSCFVIWATYFFQSNVIVAKGGNTERISVRLLTNHNTYVTGFVTFLQTIPVPLGDYIAVLKNTAIRATKPSQLFFLGSYYPKAEWYFMLVNLAMKLPIALIVLFVVSIIGSISGKNFRKVAVYCAPVFVVFAFTCFVSMQGLVRYVLPACPFIILIAATSIRYIKTMYQKIVLLILCTWYAFGTLSVYPHFLTYANEFAGFGSRKIFKFTDSNMDWGQSLPAFQKYISLTKPSSVQFSYFGRDDAGEYGMRSDFKYGSYRYNEICAFHDIKYPSNSGGSITAISLSNWYSCGYYLDPKYSKSKLQNIVGNTILVF